MFVDGYMIDLHVDRSYVLRLIEIVASISEMKFRFRNGDFEMSFEIVVDSLIV